MHIKQHYLRAYCQCGHARMSRDTVQQHINAYENSRDAKKHQDLYMVDQESYPDLCRVLEWTEPAPFLPCQPIITGPPVTRPRSPTLPRRDVRERLGRRTRSVRGPRAQPEGPGRRTCSRQGPQASTSSTHQAVEDRERPERRTCSEQGPQASTSFASRDIRLNSTSGGRTCSKQEPPTSRWGQYRIPRRRSPTPTPRERTRVLERYLDGVSPADRERPRVASRMRALRDDVERLTADIERYRRNRRYVTEERDRQIYDHEIQGLEAVLALYQQGLRGLSDNK